MPDHRTYVTSSYTAAELVRVISDRLGVEFAKRDSHFVGEYYLAEGSDMRIRVQPNVIPGDDGEDDLYDPEHADAQVLVQTSTPAADPSLMSLLTSIERLAAC